MSDISVIFLPGILMPASLRYAPLLQELGDSVQPLTKELEVYAGDTPPAGYGIETEVEGLRQTADAAGLDRFHLFGHSAGGAIGLAFIARYPERVISLAVDEPASDFSEPDRAEIALVNAAATDSTLSEQERQLAFLRLQLAEGVDPPAPPPGPPPPWMSKRPAGTVAFSTSLERHRVADDAWRNYGGPVYFSYASLSHPRWQVMCDRLAGEFSDFRSERFEGLHHLRPGHQIEPARAAASLKAFWGV